MYQGEGQSGDPNYGNAGGSSNRRGRGFHNQGYRGGGRGGYRQDNSSGYWREDGGTRGKNRGRGGGGERQRRDVNAYGDDRDGGQYHEYEYRENYQQSDRYHDGQRGRGRGGRGGQRQWKQPGPGFDNTNRQGLESTLDPSAAPFQPRDAGALLGNGNVMEYEREANYTFSNERGNGEGGNHRRRRGGSKDSRRGRPSNTQNHSDNNGEVKVEKSSKAVDDRKQRNQREVLIDQLSRNIYECMVCCEKVRGSQPIWSCKRCFNVFHISCVRKWATSSEDENGWRCPGCQSYCDSSPNDYYCFCGKVKNPKASRHDTSHTCGQLCGKPSPGGLKCLHNCNILCHPGPCPSCEVPQKRYCGCGKTNAMVVCGSKKVISCQEQCNKTLECGAHKCTNKCHPGDCSPCEAVLIHECYCSTERKQVPCTLKNNENRNYSCPQLCGKTLRCSFHKCDVICHPGSCGPCKTSVEAIMSCPCGQTPISEACKIARIPARRKCTDPIPTCGKTCQRILPCGDVNARHLCQQKCHLINVCPVCDKTSSVKCRCGSKTLEIPCKELRNNEDITCQKKCTKKKSCGKHKCNSKCCIDVDHICTIICQRQLRCGLHTCTSLCHLNPCPPCEVVSFDELPCECGASIIYPPVPCGTRRPPCHLPCSRQHSCGHPVHHPCHSEPNCPPCSVLTEKWCHGKHELRKNIKCFITELSCGMPCGMKLSCNRHSCPKTCHAGACLEVGEMCKLPCDSIKQCGHKCGAPCHENACPDVKCKVTTNVTCPCGRKEDTMLCFKRDNEYDKTVTWEYHKELKKMEEASKEKEGTAEISDEMKQFIMEEMKEKIPKCAVLECDKECAKLERNRKLAEALQVENADVTTSIGTPNYSDFLTKFAKKNPQFIETIHKQLSDLVMKAKQSRKKNETYGFISMNRDKRHVVHEYSDHFGVLSESFDEEPNRNVVCFASKEKSYLPTVSLIDAVFRPTTRAERLKPHDDVTFLPEKRTQIVGPSNWKMRPAVSTSQVVTLNIPGTSNQSSDFPPL